MDDENAKKDRLDYLKIEVNADIAAHLGALDEVLRLMLGASFHGVSIDKIEEKERAYVVAIVIVDPGLDKREVEQVTRTVREFTPKPQPETPAPTPEEALNRLDDIQRQLDKLRADIEKQK